MKKRIPFGVWEPDSNAATGLGRLTSAVNVIPMKGGYKAIFGWDAMEGAFQTYGTTAIPPAGVIGAFSAVGDTSAYSGNPAEIIATTTAVYRLDTLGTTAPIITGSAATALATEDSLFWRDFAQYGYEVYMASGLNASGTAPVCYLDLTSASATMVALGNEFQARTVTTLRDFVVFGYTRDVTDGTREHRIRWSAFGDGHNYTPSAATQSDFQDLAVEYGHIKRILGGNDVFIVCAFGVVLMEYVGGASVMKFSYIHKDVGTEHPLSCVRVADYVYMYSKSGFVRVGKTPGDIAYIGKGRVDREFDYLYTLSDSNGPPVRAYHDELNQGIGWQYSTDGRAFFYSYNEDQWTHHGTSDDRAGAFFVYASKLSYPSGLYPVNSGLLRTAGAICTSGIPKVQNDRKNKAKVVLATGFEELSPGRRSIVDKVTPVYDFRGTSPVNAELVVTSIPKLNNFNLYAEPTSTYSSTAALQNDGFFTVTGPGSYEGKFHRFQLENSDTASERAGEQAFLGIDVEYFERGQY